jgi:erythromycin esterase
MTPRRSLTLIACWVLSSPNVVCSQQSPQTLRDWAIVRAIPIHKTDNDTTNADLLPLRKLVGQARVVTYGEPTHGTHEPLAFRNRLFRFLVEQMGFTAIAIESGLTESEAIERYIAGGPGDLHEIVRNGISWGFGDFAENEELVAWMRAYNANPAHSKKLRFYGIDLSGAGNGAFPYARRSVDAALASLQDRHPAVADSLRRQLNPLLERFSSDTYERLSSGEREQLGAGLTKLGAVLTATEPSHSSTNVPGQCDWPSRNAVVAQQLNRMLETYPPPGPTPGIPPEAFRSAIARDSGMADNVLWALRCEGAGGRLLVFAHNNHVMNGTLTGGPWSAFRVPPRTMGSFLRGALRDSLFIIGSATADTTGGFPKTRADSISVDFALSRISSSSFVLDLRPAKTTPAVWEWLSQPRPLRANVTTQAIVTPASAFDAFVFFDALTGTRRSPSYHHDIKDE